MRELSHVWACKRVEKIEIENVKVGRKKFSKA